MTSAHVYIKSRRTALSMKNSSYNTYTYSVYVYVLYELFFSSYKEIMHAPLKAFSDRLAIDF